MRASQASASERPAPAAGPFTAASTGFSSARIASTFRLSSMRSRSATLERPALQLLHVLPGAEAAPLAGDHDRPHRRVTGLLERDRETGVHRRVQRVQPVGPARA